MNAIHIRRAAGVVTATLLLVVAAAAAAQMGQMGQGRGGMMRGDPAHDADMRVFHELFNHRAEITRHTVLRADGIETVTESKNPQVALLIQQHVASMLARIAERRPIHQRDPLFREIFAHADRINASFQSTPDGVRVVETSADPYVVKLLVAHAEVISRFLVNGPAEMMQNHEVPAR